MNSVAVKVEAVEDVPFTTITGAYEPFGMKVTHASFDVAY